jgi:hypothetical protein
MKGKIFKNKNWMKKGRGLKRLKDIIIKRIGKEYNKKGRKDRSGGRGRKV